MTFPSLSICLCVRNGQKYLSRCLDAILAQSQEIPLIAVNHLSTDKTADILLDYQIKYPNRIKVYSYQKEGLANVRNFAWQQAETSWIGFIDVDCVMHPGWVAQMRKYLTVFETVPRIAALGGENYVPTLSHSLYQAYQVLLPSFVGGHHSPLNRPIENIQMVEHLPTLNIVYRRKALEAVGGFDEDFQRVGEDLDLSFRLRKMKFDLYACPGVSVDHYLRDSIQLWLKNMVLYGKGRVFFLKHHHEALQVKYLIPFFVLCLYLFVILIAVVFRNPWGPLLLFVAHLLSILVGLSMSWIQKKASLKTLGLGAWVTFLTHLSYGLGMWQQLIGWKALCSVPLPQKS